MSLSISLWSRKKGEIKEFLESYFSAEFLIEASCGRWMYKYNNPLESIDMISAVVDNNDRFKIKVFIQIDNCELHEVTEENHNDIVKALFYLYSPITK